ncbi:MAG: LCP family protein [Eggerthellaceae bacterium]|jgi:LCP family protein required for cell wall assembly|nr:LCP family protein [Eggerthellaceae bacterium]
MPTTADTNDYSRDVACDRYHSQRTSKRRKHVIVTLLVIAAVLLASAGAAYAYYQHVTDTINNNFKKGLDSDLAGTLAATDSPTDPFYVLLMGTDHSITRDEDGSTDNLYRTDSIILARVDPGNQKVTLVSIPRDTKVDIEGHGSTKINAAYAYGGASLAVSTVSKVAGVDISHFVLIDMDGLSSAVDALGGVEVNVPYEINDPDYTGYLAAGDQTLNGEQALIFARARHCYDKVGDGDLIRTANQRALIGAIAEKLLQQDKVTQANVLTQLSSYVQTDLSVDDINAYANQFSGMDMDTNLYTAVMPTEAEYTNGVWFNVIQQDAWKKMMDRVTQGLPPTEEEEVDAGTGIVTSTTGDGGNENVTADSTASSLSSDSSSSSTSSSSSADTSVKTGKVVVKNGSGVGGAAKAAAKTLRASGYTVVSTGNADSKDYKTSLVVYSDDKYAGEAQAIADKIGSGCQVKKNDGTYTLSGGDLLVVLGSSDVNTD